jgi:hypothetical protein
MYYKLCQTESTYFLYDKVFLRKSISLSSGETRKGRARSRIIVMAPPTSGMMMEAARTSETSVDNYFTRQYIPGDNSERCLSLLKTWINYGH